MRTQLENITEIINQIRGLENIIGNYKNDKEMFLSYSHDLATKYLELHELAGILENEAEIQMNAYTALINFLSK